MKTRHVGFVNTFLVVLLIVGYCVIQLPIKRSFIEIPSNFSTSKFLGRKNPGHLPTLLDPKNTSKVISDGFMMSDLNLSQWNLSNEEQSSLLAWKHFEQFTPFDQFLPTASEAIRDGVVAWKKLMISAKEQQSNESLEKGGREERTCPRFLSKTNASNVFNNTCFKLWIPCGLTQGSSITFSGIADGNFQLDLIGEPLPGEQDPPIILHYNVTLHNGETLEDPIIYQNTWTNAHGWGDEERCPAADQENITKVDELLRCEVFVSRNYSDTIKDYQNTNELTEVSMENDGKPRKLFPFKKHELFVATIRVGSEGIHVTVDGNHITSFSIRETLEPWLIGQVRISGDVNVISVVASGLPILQYLEHLTDLNTLKPVLLPPRNELNLFIGVLSTAGNLKRRMAVRRSWMQYPAVRSGQVAVRFFIGLNKNHTVNEKLWNEARTFEDIQLMPFIDSYSLITWKTVAICVYGTEVVSAKFIMKTDDDSFVRIDEILNTLDRINVTRGLLYGLIYSNLEPHRERESKWYTTLEEWPDDIYPPWASGPGYVVSKDVAGAVSKKHREGHLKMFKLEDVAMGIWILDMKKKGLQVTYEKDDRIYYECKDGYVVAHQQGPGELLCLWRKIQYKNLTCCGN